MKAHRHHRAHGRSRWFGRAIGSPVRGIVHDPLHILFSEVRAGDQCLDLGCGGGFFTLPLARLVGSSGRVVAADIQPEMLEGVRRRADAAGLLDRIEPRLIGADGIGDVAAFDFVLAFWMLHEVPDQARTLSQLRRALKPGGRVLLAEPAGRVGEAAFARSVEMARDAGLRPIRAARISASRAVVLACDEE
ncbi:MAG: methyltransferase domain-containing protein [Thermoleophilia bacterium]